MKSLAVSLALALMTSSAGAAVRGLTSEGFESANSFETTAVPAKAFAAILDVGRWWSSDHTFFHDAKGLTIEPRAGGCFCEDGGAKGQVQHMRVVYLAADSILRMTGALGPLQAMPVNGVMTFVVKPTAKGSSITVTYALGGAITGGSAQWAPVVDGMVTEQVQRLQHVIDAGSPSS